MKKRNFKTLLFTTALTMILAGCGPAPSPAKAGKRLIVSFDSNGGIGAMKNQIIYEDNIVPIKKCTFENGENNFIGWAESRNGLVKYEDEFAPDKSFFVKDDNGLNLYAVWDGTLFMISKNIGAGVTINLSKETAMVNETVTFTLTIDDYHEITSMNIKNAFDGDVPYTKNNDTYSFVMPNCNISINIATKSNSFYPLPYEYTPTNQYANIWEGNTVYNEPCLLIEQEDGSISSNLIYAPSEIISVRDYSLKKEIDPSKFTITGNKIVMKAGSDLPYITKDQANGVTQIPDYGIFSGIPFAENGTLVFKYLYVSYKHTDTWQYSKPSKQGEKLPTLQYQLKHKQELNLVVYGDSISEGLWSTQMLQNDFQGDGRFKDKDMFIQERYSDALKSEIERRYGNKVNLYNPSVRGEKSAWGLANVEEKVNLYSPDIVVIAFGMNDGTNNQVSVETYKSNILGIINAVKAKKEDVSFVLVGTMIPNKKNAGMGNLHANYVNALKEIANSKTNVVVADMTTLSTDLYKTKTTFDLLVNNMHHPGDFLTRCYVETILNAMTASSTKGYEYLTQDWSIVNGTGTFDVKDDSVVISGFDGFGKSARFNHPVDFNGLEFELGYQNTTNNQTSCFGIFFTPTNAQYVPDLNQVFSKLTIVEWCMTSNTQIGLANNHNYASTPTVYLKPDLNSAIEGLNANANPVVFNNIKVDTDSSYYNGVKINIDSYNDDFYSIKLTEKYQETMWHDNKNYSNGSVTYYLAKKDINFLDPLGKCYINAFGFGDAQHQGTFGKCRNIDVEQKPDIDLYLMAGQSNMVGYSNVNDYTDDQGVVYPGLPADIKSHVFKNSITYFEGEGKDNHPARYTKWFKEMTPGSMGLSDSHFGPEVGFADVMEGEYPSVAIADKKMAIVKFAIGGSAMYDHWFSPSAYLKGNTNHDGGMDVFGSTAITTGKYNGKIVGDYYQQMVITFKQRISELSKHYNVHLKGFLWMQGEHDGVTEKTSNLYESNLTDFINDLRVELNAEDLKFVLGQIYKNITGAGYVQKVRESQLKVAQTMENVDIVITDNYSTYNFFGDAHFTADSMLSLGREMANKLKTN